MDLPEVEFDPTMPNAIRRATKRFGQNELLVMPGLRMTFEEADLASRRVACELLAFGVGKGTRIAIHFPYGPDWIVAFFAITRIGAVCLPLSTSFRPAELRRAVVHGDVDTLLMQATNPNDEKAIFMEQAFPSLVDAGEGPHYLKEAPFLRSFVVTGSLGRPWAAEVSLGFGQGDSGKTQVSDLMLEAVESQVVPGDWCMVIQTSGTTGEPKGAIHTHGAFVRHNENLSRFLGWTEERTQYSGLPWFWIGGVVLSVGHALAQGFTLLALEKFENQGALDLIIEEQPEQVGMWGQLLQRFYQYAAASGRDLTGVPAMDFLMGEPVDPGLRHNSLGQTETLGPHTGAGPEIGRELPEELRGSFGLPVPHVEHRVVDPETGEDVETGEEGEILIRGYSLSAGLYKRERHEAFDDDGWLHTGDRGYFKKGYLFFTGRFTEMIKTLGANVSPREVELVLEMLPEVSLAVVLGIPDEERGQIVGAVLVPTPGHEVDLEVVRVHAMEQVSSYKVPRCTLLVPSEEMPSLGSGKPDKLALLAMLEEAVAASSS